MDSPAAQSSTELPIKQRTKVNRAIAIIGCIEMAAIAFFVGKYSAPGSVPSILISILITAAPFLIVTVLGSITTRPSIVYGSLVYLLTAFFSCWTYVQLAYRLIPVHSTESLALLFLPFFQVWAYLGYLAVAEVIYRLLRKR